MAADDAMTEYNTIQMKFIVLSINSW